MATSLVGRFGFCTILSNMQSLQMDYRRLLIVVNPTKKNTRDYRRAELQIAYLASALELHVARIEMSRASSKTVSRIVAAVEPHDLVLVESGDGGMNLVVTALMRVGQHHRPDIIQVPVGTANDTFRSLNGALHGTRMLARILKSPRVHIHPLCVSVQTADGESSIHLAVSYVGFNYTAELAKLINGSAHRTGKLRMIPLIGIRLQDAYTWARSFSGISAFDSYEQDGTKVRQVVDRIIMHSRVVGRYGRPKARHADDVFEDYVSVRSTRRGVFSAVLRVVFGMSNGQKRKMVSFTLGEQPIQAHVDGETFIIKPRSTVTVTLHPESVTTYSVLAARK
jgi:diacylglycerol kinase family enzyme